MQEENKQEAKNIKTISKAIASIVKKHRKDLGKSIYAISAEVAMSKETWRSVEVCKTKSPTIANLWKIAEALDIPLEDLIKEVREKLGKDFSLSDLN